MQSERWLSVSLLLALGSNASLLVLLTFNVLHNGNSPSEQYQQTNTEALGYQQFLERKTLRLCEKLIIQYSGDPDQNLVKKVYNKLDITSKSKEEQNSLMFESNELKNFQHSRKPPEINKETISSNGDEGLNKRTDLFLQLYEQLTDIGLKLQLLRSGWELSSYNDVNRPSGTETRQSIPMDEKQPSKLSAILNSKKPSVKNHGRFDALRSVLNKSRTKRDAALIDLTAGPDGDYLDYEFQFAKLIDNETQAFSSAVSNILIPGLVKFEGRMIRHLEELHFSMVSHDLRLERLERAVLNLAKGRDPDSTSYQKRGDQLLEPISSEDLDKLANGADDFFSISDTDQLGLSSNVSLEELDVDSSGDSDVNITLASSIKTTTSTSSTTTTTSTTTSTTTRRPSPPTAFYDLQRDMQEVKHKVLALENFNTMSDSELTRVRSEVVRMDDKVIEMQRVQKNANSVMGQHTYKINEIEMVTNRNSMALTTAMDAYGRMNFRVEEFRDRLADFEREMHGVTTHFSKHEQISNELRSADSYKAHDIMEIRKSMVNVETRINEMYNMVDQRLEGVQSDIYSVVDRLCFNNDLIC